MGQFRSSKDVLDCVCNDKVLVADKAVDGLLILFRDGLLRCVAALIFADFCLFNKDGVASSLLGKSCCIRLGSSLNTTESSRGSLSRVRTTFEVKFTREVGAYWL